MPDLALDATLPGPPPERIDRRPGLAAALALALASASTLASAEPAGRSALERLPALESYVLDGQGRPLSLRANLGSFHDSSSVQDLRRLAELLGPLYGARADEFELVSRASGSDGLEGGRYLHLQQRIDGLPVLGTGLSLHIDGRTGAIELANGKLMPTAGLPREALLAARPSLELARRQELGGRPLTYAAEPELGYAFGVDERPHLVWSAVLSYSDGDGPPRSERLAVDALDGRLIAVDPLVYDARQREIWSAEGGSNVLGVLHVYTEGDPIRLKTLAGAAYANFGSAWDYFYSRFGRDSYDGNGHEVHGTVNFSVAYNNAHYVPQSEAFVFGNGDGTLFEDFVRARDVVGHEFTHGVTYHSSDLNYGATESGALNESMSDVFGAAVEASVQGVSASTWKVGEDAYTPAVNGDALRYMNDPRLDYNAQAGTYSRDDYHDLYSNQNECGVHLSSGIGNLAFYLSSQGGSHPRGVTSNTVAGIGLDKAARVFYSALVSLPSDASFAAAREQTAQAAGALYGWSSPERAAVCGAWDAVRVPGKACGSCGGVPCVAPAAPASLQNRNTCYGMNDMTWPAVPGASYYRVFVAYQDSDVYYRCSALTMAFEGETTGTVTVTPGMTNYKAKIQACNDQGCSALSTATATLRYRNTCL